MNIKYFLWEVCPFGHEVEITRLLGFEQFFNVQVKVPLQIYLESGAEKANVCGKCLSQTKTKINYRFH